MDNNFRNFRLKLIFLALCILILLAIKGHIKLGYVTEPEGKSIAVAFDYYGAFENEVEILVSRLEEAYMDLRGIKDIHSVSESGKGYIICLFSDKTSLDEAYVQISDITAHVYSDFPERVNRPVITRSSADIYPVYISYFPLEMVAVAERIKEAYESVPGVGEVQIGGTRKKELMLELHTGRFAGMALSTGMVDSRLRSSNLAREVAMTGGKILVLDSMFSSPAEYGQVYVAPGLRLSDIADLKYRDVDAQSLGHIDGKSALLFFIMKSGEGDTIRLCRQLDSVTSHFGGSQFFSLGNKIKKSFIFSSSMLLLLFVFLLFGLWFKARSYHLAVQATCRCIGSLLAAIAAVAAAGYQLDITVMAALFLVVVFSFWQNGFHNKIKNAEAKMTEDEIEKAKQLENNIVSKVQRGIIRAEEGKKVRQVAFEWVENNIKQPVKTQIGYVIFNGNCIQDSLAHGYGADKLDAIPAIKDILHNGTYLGGKKDFNRATINNHFFAGKVDFGDCEKIVFCRVRESEGDQARKRFYVHEVFTEDEVKGLPSQTGTATKGGKKSGGKPLYLKILHDVLTVKPNKVFKTIDTETGESMFVNHETDRIKRFIFPSFFILSTLLITLYSPVHMKALVLPFCIALASGLCASVICQCFMKKSSFPRGRIPLWGFSPILLFALGMAPFSLFSPFSTDVNFSMEYESGTAYPFVQKSALDIEAALMKWNAFDRLTLHINQGRASFTILGGKKRDILAKINELSSRYPEIFFYIPEKHTKHAINMTVYGNEVSEIENNVLQLAKYVNKSANNVKIIYNFKSDMQNIVLEIPVKCASSGFYPYDVYKALYYTASEPVVDKYFVDGVETDVKIRGEEGYRKSLAGLLSVPILSPFGIAGEAGDYIMVRREWTQGRIYHKNRMRVLSFSVKGLSRAKLRKLVSDFPFSGSCHGEVH